MNNISTVLNKSIDYLELGSKQPKKNLSQKVQDHQNEKPENEVFNHEELMKKILDLLDCSEIDHQHINPNNSESINNLFLEVLCKHLEFKNG